MAVSLRDALGRGNVNVGKKERWAFALGGAALAALALRKRSKGKGALGLAALGAPLLWRGATGHCPVYQRMGIDRTQHQPIAEVEGTEGRPVTTTDLQPIGQTF